MDQWGGQRHVKAESTRQLESSGSEKMQKQEKQKPHVPQSSLTLLALNKLDSLKASVFFFLRKTLALFGQLIEPYATAPARSA